MTVREKIERLLELRQMRAADLSRRTGIAPQVIHRWRDPEDGRKPTLAQGAALARAFGVPLDYLADDRIEGDPPSGLSVDDLVVLEVWRASGLSAQQAARAILDASRSADEPDRSVVRFGPPAPERTPRPAQPPAATGTHGPAPTTHLRPKNSGRKTPPNS